MIDPHTGSLRIGDLALSPSLTRARFLASRAGRAAQREVQNGPHRSWRVTTATEAGRPFIVVLYFIGARLDHVDVCDSSPKYGRSWNDWSLAKERARKAAHDAWLCEGLGRRRRFDWGRVESLFDARAGDSSVIVTYVAPESSRSHSPPWPRRTPAE